jgi:hypothetical protein
MLFRIGGLKAMRSLRQGATILEAGCGRGAGARLMLKRQILYSSSRGKVKEAPNQPMIDTSMHSDIIRKQ